MRADSAMATYLKFVAAALGLVVFLVGVGYFPTRNLGGAEAVVGMWVGCSVSLLGSVFGAIPIARFRGPPRDRLAMVMASSALRLLIVGALAVAAAWSGFFQKIPLLLWVAISYLILLVVDTSFAVGRWPRNAGRENG